MSILTAFAVRLLLVGLFLPFSALDKALNFQAAVDQAASVVRLRPLATLLIVGGFCVELTTSLAILTGIADRLAALILGGYCIVTALLWKQFWRTPDFRLKGPSQGRELFWDFLKNLSVAGGLLILAIGADAAGVPHLLDHPLASSHPYVQMLPGARG